MAVALGLVPLGFVVVGSLRLGLSEVGDLLLRRRVAELLWNTVRLAGATAVLTAVLGVGGAWLVEGTDLPFRRLWRALLAAPLAVPAFVNSYSWVSLTSRVEGFGGAVLIVTLSYFPLVELPVAAALRGLDREREEAARTLGLGRWATFVRVTFPQLRPALVGGVALVVLHLLAEFGALQLLRFPTFTTAIYEQYQATFNGSAATLLAGVLVTLCALVVLGEVRLGGAARQARVGGGSPRPRPPHRLGTARWPAVLGLAALAALSVGLPLANLGRWLADGASSGLELEELTRAVLATLRLGLAAAAVTTLAALPLAWLAVRHRSALTTTLERSTYVGRALPGIVVALALVSVTVRWPAVYQRTPVVLAGYVVLFLPLALVSQRASLAQVPPVLDDVARSLGCRPRQVARRVVLPVIAPGLATGAALVFLAAATELTATLLLAPTGTDTLATRFWSNADALAYGAAAPYAALMIALSVPATALLVRRSRA